MTCSRLQAPIVLAHGLFGFSRIGLGPLTLAAYFQGIPDFLRAAGNRVLVTRVHPTAGIRRRARVLAQRIDAAFPDGEPVHLVGHSMGGLDARQLLADPAWQGRALSLTTVGSPHLGSAVADAARLRMGGVYRALERVGLDHSGFFDVTRRAARRWHRQTPAPEGVACFSIAGEPSAAEVCWPMWPTYKLLHAWEGPNDGLVSVASAEAFGTPLPPAPLDHLRQMNWLTSGRRGEIDPGVVALYARILENLEQVERGLMVGSGADLALNAGSARRP